MDLSNLEAVIIFPIEICGKIVNLIFKYAIEIFFIVGAIFIIEYLFKSGIIRRISELIIDMRNKRKSKEMKGGNENAIQDKEESTNSETD